MEHSQRGLAGGDAPQTRLSVSLQVKSSDEAVILCKTAIGALKLNIGDLQVTKVRWRLEWFPHAGVLEQCRSALTPVQPCPYLCLFK